MPSKQLDLFKDDALEQTAKELDYFINAMKSQANQIMATHGPDTKAQVYSAEIARLTASLLSEISPLTKCFKNIDRDGWIRRGVYEPLYRAWEPLSPLEVYRAAIDYKVFLYAILLRFKACLKTVSKPRKEKVEKIVDKMNYLAGEIVKELYNPKFKDE